MSFIHKFDYPGKKGENIQRAKRPKLLGFQAGKPTYYYYSSPQLRKLIPEEKNEFVHKLKLRMVAFLSNPAIPKAHPNADCIFMAQAK